MLEELRENIETEIRVLREIALHHSNIPHALQSEKRLLIQVIDSLTESMKMLNAAIPTILREEPVKVLPTLRRPEKKIPSLEKINFQGKEISFNVIVNSQDKERFFKELSISEAFLKRIKKRKRLAKEEYYEFKASRGYLKLANKYFFNQASSLIKKGYFKPLSLELRRANIDILFESYTALILMSVFLSIIFSILIFSFLIFFEFSLAWPIISVYEGSYLARILKIFWIPIAIPIVVFAIFYYYPSTEKKSLESHINQELPFAVIHMSAISGSGIAPAEIFRIIALSHEYQYLRKEIRKIFNQINLYGYDLITALNNVTKTSPSEKLSELFAGLSVTITSGADLSEFFEKRAESLLLNYRIEREKYTKLVETFLDIYISIVITAPLIFLLLVVIMTLSGINIGFTPGQLGLLSVLGVTLLNILFLVFLQIKQPGY